MRDVKVIKEQRNRLRDELATYTEVKMDKFPTPTNYKDLGEFDRQLFGYIMSCTNSLKSQINALEFVLNEDTEMNDYTASFGTQRECGINKDLVFSMAKKDTDIENLTFYS